MMALPMDVFVIVGTWVVATLFTFFTSKSKAVSVILALVSAILLFQTFPFVTNLTVLTGAVPQALNVVGIFLLFTVGMYFLFNRYVVGDFFNAKFLKSALFGLGITALLLAIVHFVLPFDAIYNFSPKVDAWFGGNFGLFWWVLAPLLLVFFL